MGYLMSQYTYRKAALQMKFPSPFSYALLFSSSPSPYAYGLMFTRLMYSDVCRRVEISEVTSRSTVQHTDFFRTYCSRGLCNSKKCYYCHCCYLWDKRSTTNIALCTVLELRYLSPTVPRPYSPQLVSCGEMEGFREGVASFVKLNKRPLYWKATG